MRDTLEVQFADAYTGTVKWQYFFDPGNYAYLRMSAQDAFPAPLFESFMQRLKTWCLDTLGLAPAGHPNLHLMINGCRLGLHSDFHNGVWGYVYSLTKWDERKFTGGETLLLRDGIPSYKRHHVHGDDLYELFAAQFNQLLVFDDRLVHGTPTIEGSMDPREGRIAMVGHIRATPPIVSDMGSAAEVRSLALKTLEHLRERLQSYKDVQGMLSYRIIVAGDGAVDSITPLTDTLVTPLEGYDRSEAALAVRSIVKRAIAGLKFGALPPGTVIVLPILLPLPDLRPIEFSVPHNSSKDAIRTWVDAQLSKDMDISGTWEGASFSVREPVAGELRVEQTQIACSFDPPMWVPSQREQFRLSLFDRLKSAWDIRVGQETASA